MQPIHAVRAALLLLTQLPLAALPAARPIVADSWKLTSDRNEQFTRDVDFFYATLFPDPKQVQEVGTTLLAGMKGGIMGQVQSANGGGAAPKVDLKAVQAVLTGMANDDKTERILGRVFLAMAYGGLKYCNASNDVDNLKDWTWQMATALGHGQRVLLDLKSGDANELYSLLITGAVQDAKAFADPYGRSAASHSLGWAKGTGAVLGHLTEVKNKGVSGAYRSVADGLAGKHHGINLAFGGLAGIRLDGHRVGPGGSALDTKRGFLPISGLQHGHLYLFHSNRVENNQVVEGGVLVGLEKCGPMATNMYGTKHTPASGMHNVIHEPSVDGGQKMQLLLGKEGPAEIGGLWVTFSPNRFKELQKVIRTVDQLPQAERMELFDGLLRKDGPAARAFLAPYNR
jgi:hypothetical protein